MKVAALVMSDLYDLNPWMLFHLEVHAYYFDELMRPLTIHISLSLY